MNTTFLSLPIGEPIQKKTMDFHKIAPPKLQAGSRNTNNVRWVYSPDKNAAQTLLKRTLTTFGGVFCPVALSQFSTILFLRLGFIVGEAGIWITLAMFFIAYLLLFLTILSICAISTNGAIETGGVYFMISRTLGPEFGGAVGLMFYFANCFSCALYVSGFVESLINNFGVKNGITAHFMSEGAKMAYLYGFIAMILIVIVCLVGASLYAKASLFIFAVVFGIYLCVIGNFFWGHPHSFEFNVTTHHANSHSHAHYPPAFNWTTTPNSVEMTGKFEHLNTHTFMDNVNPSAHYSFQLVFAILFSGVTGIMNGANMSGELKNPSKSIPFGTISATLFTLVCFLFAAFLTAASCNRPLLKHEYLYLQKICFRPELIIAGSFATTLSAALGNLIGASRVLEALANDQIFGPILNFVKIKTKGDNPIFAVLISFVIVLLVLLIGNLNAISTFVSPMFMIAYASVNLACMLLDVAAASNFRPSFRWFSWHSSLLGLAGCLILCVYINTIPSVFMFSLFCVIVAGLHYAHLRRGGPAGWGHISQALLFHQIRKYALMLDARKDHVKYWRPHILLLTSNIRSQAHVARFLNDLKKGGLFVLGHVIPDKMTQLQTQLQSQTQTQTHSNIASSNNHEPSIVAFSPQTSTEFSGQSDGIALRKKSWTTQQQQQNVDPSLRLNNVYVACKEYLRLKAFVQLTVSGSIRDGARHLIRLSGLGAMKPNTVCLGFYDEVEPDDALLEIDAARKKPSHTHTHTHSVQQHSADDAIQKEDAEGGREKKCKKKCRERGGENDDNHDHQHHQEEEEEDAHLDDDVRPIFYQHTRTASQKLRKKLGNLFAKGSQRIRRRNNQEEGGGDGRKEENLQKEEEKKDKDKDERGQEMDSSTLESFARYLPPLRNHHSDTTSSSLAAELRLSRLDYIGIINDCFALQKNVCVLRHFSRLDRERLVLQSRVAAANANTAAVNTSSGVSSFGGGDVTFAGVSGVGGGHDGPGAAGYYIDIWPINFFQPGSASFLDNTGGFMLQLACVLRMVPAWRRCVTALRLFICVDAHTGDTVSGVQTKWRQLLRGWRIPALLKLVNWDDILIDLEQNEHASTLLLSAPHNRDTSNTFATSTTAASSSLSGTRRRNSSISSLPSPINDNHFEQKVNVNAARQRRSTTASQPPDIGEFKDNLPAWYISRVNDLIRSHSENTAVTFLYLPRPPPADGDGERRDADGHSDGGGERQLFYLEQLERLTDGLPPCVLSHGLHEVLADQL